MAIFNTIPPNEVNRELCAPASSWTNWSGWRKRCATAGITSRWIVKGEKEMAKSTMIWPKCGNEMYHHADRLIYSSEAREAANFDASLGGLVEETHGCPGCGAVASRIAA
jgi:ribosomal protein S27AE